MKWPALLLFVVPAIVGRTEVARVTAAATNSYAVIRADRKDPLEVKGGRVRFTLAPDETAVYLDHPVKFSVEDGRREIARREAARRKPGNLAVAPRFLTSQEVTWVGKGVKKFDYPKFTASSTKRLQYNYAGEYFLQDGIDEPFLYNYSLCWQPEDKDAEPAVTLEFGRHQKVQKVVVTRVIDEQRAFPVKRVALEIDGWRLAESGFNADHRAVFEFPETECDKLTVRVTGFDRGVSCGWLAEVEAY